MFLKLISHTKITRFLTFLVQKNSVVSVYVRMKSVFICRHICEPPHNGVSSVYATQEQQFFSLLSVYFEFADSLTGSKLNYSLRCRLFPNNATKKMFFSELCYILSYRFHFWRYFQLFSPNTGILPQKIKNNHQD